MYFLSYLAHSTDTSGLNRERSYSDVHNLQVEFKTLLRQKSSDGSSEARCVNYKLQSYYVPMVFFSKYVSRIVYSSTYTVNIMTLNVFYWKYDELFQFILFDCWKFQIFNQIRICQVIFHRHSCQFCKTKSICPQNWIHIGVHRWNPFFGTAIIDFES